MDEFEGRQLGPYRIESLIGRGGMGDVYLAHHERLDRPCALKVLRPLLAADRDLRQRFVREAQAAARLDHPNIVTIYDAGEEDGVAYFAMQFVEGEPLTALIQAGEIPTVEALRIVRDIAQALDSAHQSGMVHRDVKPANIIIAPDGTAMLTDFGIVHLQPEAQLTVTGQLLGTPAYMSPEQIAGGEITPQTDVYQLAVVAYELLTRELPFRATEPAALLVAHLHEVPVPLDERVVDAPPAATATLNRALHKLPTERQQTAIEFVTELEAGLSKVNPTRALQPDPQRPRTSRFDDTTTPRDGKRRGLRLVSRRNGIALSVAVAGVLGAILLWSTFSAGPDDDAGEVLPTATVATVETATANDEDGTGQAAAASSATTDRTVVGPNTDDVPRRSENILASYSVLDLWPPELEGITQVDVDGTAHMRLETPDVSGSKIALGANMGDGSAYLEASMLSNPGFYVDECLLARVNAAGTQGYALCLNSDAESFAFYFDDEIGDGLQVELLPPSVRTGTGQPMDWNDLEIRAVGDHLWFLINDVVLGAATYDGPRSGDVGVAVFRAGSEPFEMAFGVLATLELQPD